MRNVTCSSAGCGRLAAYAVEGRPYCGPCVWDTVTWLMGDVEPLAQQPAGSDVATFTRD